MYVSETTKGVPFPKGSLRPYGPLSLEPAATVLNYGQGLFEGAKAFRTAKNRIVLFRPHENSKRLNYGASKFVMPPVPEEVFMHGVDEVVRANSQWVPPVDQGALYLRPVLFGSGAALGVSPSPSYTFCIWVSPVGPYFKGGRVTPIALLASNATHRASPKGSGEVKAIGNYAPCFLTQKQAKEQGFAEVLFLDAKEEKYVEEAGASNFFCVTKERVIMTPGLSGTILPGITRNSIATLMRDRGYTVVDNRRLPLSVVCSAEEAFCSGTGASVTPVGSITYEGKKYLLGDGRVGEITKEATKALLDIQMEKAEDKYGWLHDPWKN